MVNFLFFYLLSIKKRFDKFLSTNKGFTLLEIVVGTTLLSAAALALHTATNSSLKAEKKLEGLQSLKILSMRISFDILTAPGLFPSLNDPTTTENATDVYLQSICFSESLEIIDHNKISVDNRRPHNAGGYSVIKTKNTDEMKKINTGKLDQEILKDQFAGFSDVNQNDKITDAHCNKTDGFKYIAFIYTHKKKSIFWVYSIRSNNTIESIKLRSITNVGI